MEQSSNESTITYEDMEVAKIMLELPHLILQSLSRNRFAFTSWLCKKKRSSTAKVVSTAAARPPSPPSSLPSNAETVEPKEKPLTSSPDTPLAFSPSESDEKHKPEPSKRKSYVNNLKKKEQLIDIMEDFTRRNELLNKDIEITKRFYDQQMAENVGLKAKKQKLLETSKSLNFEIELPHIAKETENSTASYYHYHHHEQRVVNHEPLMNNDQTVHKPETNKNCEYPIDGMICWVPGGISKLQQQQHDNVGPVGLFDLNVSAEEAFFYMDMDMHTVKKARAAEARFKRKQICRFKNFNTVYKSSYLF